MRDTDRNFFSVADSDGRVLEGLRLDPADTGDDPDAFDDTLKFSNARNCRVNRCWIRGGSENAVDLNRRCENIQIENTRLGSGLQCAVVVKGGSTDITLSHVSISPGRRRTAYDIELGGWSDQSMGKTRRVVLSNVSRYDGRPVRVVVGRAEPPTIIGGNCRVLFWWSLALKGFWAARWVAAKVLKRGR